MKILVAMSGGVDSSVTAGLLKNSGHEVIGVTMKLWEGENGEMPTTGCCTALDSEDARKVASKLDIPYYVLDYTASFSTSVVENFIQMYSEGLTPNPCVECNRKVKFDHFIDQAKKLGCEKVATGHYAKIVIGEYGYELHRSDYLPKDQSYVLHMLSSEKLEKVLFPLGTLSKPEVRKIAAELGLDTAFKKDSQDICFVGEKGYRSFVDKRVDLGSPGKIINTKGHSLGVHGGIHKFTVGQRRGLPGGQGDPLFVLEIDPLTGNVIVGNKQDLLQDVFYLDEVSFVNGFTSDDLLVQIRYNAKPLPCEVDEVERGIYKVILSEPTTGVSPGQFGVLYSGSRLVGGGRIVKNMVSEVSIV